MKDQQIVPELLIDSTHSELQKRIAKKRELLAQTNKKLGSIEQRFETTFEMAAVGIVLVNKEGKLLRANNKFHEILGYSRNEIDGFTFETIVFQDPSAPTFIIEQEFFEREFQNYSLQKQFIRKDKTLVWINLTASFVRDQQGHEDYVIVIIQDLDEKFKLESSLREREQRLYMVLNASNVAAWEWDPVNDLITSTSNWIQVFGVEKKTFREFGEHVHPDDLPNLKSAIESSLSTRISFKCRSRFLRPNCSEYLWVEGRGSFTKAADGTVRMSGVTIDVSETVMAEEAYNESIKEFATLAESVPNIVWIADENGHITYWNRRWYEFTQRPVESSLGTKWWEVVHPDDLKVILSNREDRLRDGRSEYIEFRIRHHSGEYHWFLGKGTPIYNSKGQIIKWFGTTTNIDEQKKAQQTIQDSLRARDQFISMSSHELKTPIAALKLHLGLLSTKFRKLPLSNQEFKIFNESIETSVRQIDHLARLVENLLDVSHSQMGQLNVVLEKENASELLKDILNRFYEPLKRAHKSIDVQIQKNIFLFTDKIKFEQVIINLLSNAIKYAPGKPISILLKQENSRIQITIKDQGPGIHPDLHHKIFDLFTRTPTLSQNNIKGLGIGLYIAQQITQALHGKIILNSEPGQGAEFILEFPANS